MGKLELVRGKNRSVSVGPVLCLLERSVQFLARFLRSVPMQGYPHRQCILST